MWKKIKEILCKHTTYKDDSTTTIGQHTVATSVINLKPLPPTPSRQTETLHHHNHNHRLYRKAVGKSTLNKTDDHCRSLFNLLPVALRPRQLHQTSNSNGVDASTTTEISPSIDIFSTDYDSGYMSQSILNRTPSYASCYSAVATTVPIQSLMRHGSIESLLHGHSKSNPANVRVLVRKNFDSFAQAHISVTKGAIVTALFSRGPWLYIRCESTGQTGYIPRIICSLYKNCMTTENKKYPHHHLSISSADSLSNKDEELDLTTVSKSNEKFFIHPYRKPPINRYLSHSSTIINDQSKSKELSKKRLVQINSDDRERRNTCNLSQPPPPPPVGLSSTLTLKKDRRLTINSINWPLTTKNSDIVGIHQMNDSSTGTNNGGIISQRDTDSSGTQDSGFSESTPYFLVQQPTSESEQQVSSVKNSPQKSTSSPHYASIRHSAVLKIPDQTKTQHNSLRRHPQETNGSNRSNQHRHTLVNGLSIADMLKINNNKRHSFGAFYIHNNENSDLLSAKSINPMNNSSYSHSNEYALIRNMRRERNDLYQQIKPSIHKLPESHQQIPASIFLNHHRQQQKQQFGSSHSAFRPVQPTSKSKRASSEGHSPTSEHQRSSPAMSTTSSSLSSSSNSSLSNIKKSFLLKQRRLSCDVPITILSQINSNSLTRSVCDQTSAKKLSDFSRTMSDTLCDQFSEINLDAIEKDSLSQPTVKKNEQKMKKILNIQQNIFTITKDYRSSRASFSVNRGDYVHVIKQVGRACFLVRKQSNGQIGFLPKAIIVPTSTTSTKVDTFLEMHGYRETVI